MVLTDRRRRRRRHGYGRRWCGGGSPFRTAQVDAFIVELVDTQVRCAGFDSDSIILEDADRGQALAQTEGIGHRH